ncbi:hypothetical protein ECTPHS_09443 [Ectothiorhodospira sp. PHS-1]|uniref:hypothetical protein n=1 Tax=Ectothiorhodospira sp. PHS-1 TaxID=519989 RepID=UPI00024A8704|nr:hypothetical protein [Ectothiorhodospira sp. PHS-1]EHQ52905.1 hypothetical protein ECTPHS_09443 [Ectothiorhodospira sp. PHS-1]
MTEFKEIRQAANEGVGYGDMTPVMTAFIALAVGEDQPALARSMMADHGNPGWQPALDTFDQAARQIMSDRLDVLERQTGDSVLACCLLADDPLVPGYLRLELRRKLAEGLRRFMPGMKPTGMDAAGRPCYRIEDVATAIGTSTEELQRMADDAGIDGTPAGSVSRIQ